MTDREKLDEITKRLITPEGGDDPYCCIPLRQDLMNTLRQEFGLEPIVCVRQRTMRDFFKRGMAL